MVSLRGRDEKALLSESCSPWKWWSAIHFKELMIMAAPAPRLWMGSCICCAFLLRLPSLVSTHRLPHFLQFYSQFLSGVLIHSCQGVGPQIEWFRQGEIIRGTVMQFLAGGTQAFIMLVFLYLGATSSARPCHLRTTKQFFFFFFLRRLHWPGEKERAKKQHVNSTLCSSLLYQHW